MGRYDGILISGDFDHTMTGLDGKVPQANLDAVQYFIREGGRITVNTGRSVEMFRQFKDMVPVNAPHLLYNGALCYDYDKEQIVFSHPVENVWELAAQVMARYPQYHYETQGLHKHFAFNIEDNRLEMFRQLGVGLYDVPHTQINDPMYMLFLCSHFVRPDDTTQPLSYCTPEEDVIFEECAAFVRSCGKYNPIRSTKQNMEIAALGVNKGSAARQLKEVLGCHTLVCIGDGANDLDMLGAADIAYTPADGEMELREKLGQRLLVCKPCSEGSVADVIYKL